MQFNIYHAIILVLALVISQNRNTYSDQSIQATSQYVTLKFNGPHTLEQQKLNPFTDYRLVVTFKHGSHTMVVRGFYAADGDAANSGADQGNVWCCRFCPDQLGEWTYEARLSRGSWIAIDEDVNSGETLPIENNTGGFIASTKETQSNALELHGRIKARGQYFYHADGTLWLKAGANSPENLLAYVDFDDTYRINTKTRDGEASAESPLHKFEPHRDDWREGDPTWRGGQGKSIIGALNYLASTGMNSIYFLTMNIGGDGNDVWPYVKPDDVTRFDCSKLDQWEVVFAHAQRLGLALHVITQETENETKLDGGDTGQHRKLYYRELIARFAHHRGIIWDLGEESGPAPWKKHPGISNEQQRAMADYIASHDPYANTVLIHTHASRNDQEHILTPLLGHQAIEGLSLQVNDPNRVHADVLHWRKKSMEANRPWLVSMDEIGPADYGAPPDAVDANQDKMRGDVLWGSLMAGAAGVEWYFGYKLAHNDLAAEDWRSRAELWKQTSIAHRFMIDNKIDTFLPSDDLIRDGKGFCISKAGEAYIVYRFEDQSDTDFKLDLSKSTDKFKVEWLHPRTGDRVKSSSQLTADESVSIGPPPSDADSDWVVLLSRE
jgi:hypothetical protein